MQGSAQLILNSLVFKDFDQCLFVIPSLWHLFLFYLFGLFS